MHKSFPSAIVIISKINYRAYCNEYNNVMLHVYIILLTHKCIFFFFRKNINNINNTNFYKFGLRNINRMFIIVHIVCT